MPHLPRRFAGLALTLGCLAAAAISIQPSATRAGSVDAPLTSKPGADPGSLDLAPEQVEALRIEPAASHAFDFEKQAVGSVSFEEDPAIVQAESTLLAAAASLDVSEKELKRVRKLGEDNGIAQKELEQSVATEETARAALEAARDALRALGKSDAEIDRLITSGKIASPQRSQRKWAVASVAESDSIAVHPGQPVSLAVMAYPGRTFAGKVSRVSAAVDPGTHRLPVRAEISDPRNELRAGMLAEFTIRVAPAIRSLAIPANAAVRETDGTTSVWVTSDSRHFSRRTVRSGEREAGWVQILDGVRPGELVVTDGAVFLSNLLKAPPSD